MRFRRDSKQRAPSKVGSEMAREVKDHICHSYMGLLLFLFFVVRALRSHFTPLKSDEQIMSGNEMLNEKIKEKGCKSVRSGDRMHFFRANFTDKWKS